MGRELASLVERAVDALPEIYRSVYMLRQIEGLSTADTAAVLDISEALVKQRLHRAKVQLAAMAEDALPRAFGFDGASCDRMVARVLAALADHQA